MMQTALWSVAVLLALAPAGIALSMKKQGSAMLYVACLVVTSVLVTIALLNLLDPAHPVLSATLPIGLPWLGAHFRIDPLAAFFLVVVNFGGAAASLFALGYGRHEDSPGRVLPFYPAYLAGMNIVVLADDAFSFLVAWEFMSLTSWALVVSHHREAENVRAGYVYLLMAGFGTLALLLAFGVLAGGSGHYDFAAIRAIRPTASVAGAVLLLALVGAGSKAGLVPLHAWLPLAHPAAPSHVSGLMSGVMTKVAIYGFVRIVFDLLGPPEWWWSMVVLGIGGPSAALGVLYALMQRDIKRVLAYSTIENIGIVFVGLGLALAFKAQAMNWIAALAFTAALLHVFNHMAFKSLLFFGAGSVLNATGARDLEKLGGLIHRMPQTAFAMLVGCVAISALTLQRLCLGMADVPGDPAQPATAVLGVEADYSRGRRIAGARGRSGCSVFRQTFRRELPRPCADTDSRWSAGGRSLLARRHVRAGGALPDCRHLSRSVHRCAGTSRGIDGW
jgi:hydrogenase-4 component B